MSLDTDLLVSTQSIENPIQFESLNSSPLSSPQNLSPLISSPSIISDIDYQLSSISSQEDLTIPTAPALFPNHTAVVSAPSLIYPTHSFNFPAVNMNINHNPLSDMPLIGDKKAPKKFKGKYTQVTSFIKQYNRLLDIHHIILEEDKCEGVLEYCSRQVREFIESSPHYSTPNWQLLEADILKYYDAEKEDNKYSIGDFLDFLSEASSHRLKNLERWKEYYRNYMARAGHLHNREYITDTEYHGYFWLGIPASLRTFFEDKLFSRHPAHDASNPWSISQVAGVAESHFKRGKYSDRLLQLPNKFIRTHELEYPSSDSGSNSDNSGSNSDSEREDHKKHKINRKKLDKYRKSSRKPATHQIKEDRTRVISAPQEEIEGIISKLNTMSIDDPNYGLLYYKALSSDPSGLIAQCIRRIPVMIILLAILCTQLQPVCPNLYPLQCYILIPLPIHPIPITLLIHPTLIPLPIHPTLTPLQTYHIQIECPLADCQTSGPCHLHPNLLVPVTFGALDVEIQTIC